MCTFPTFTYRQKDEKKHFFTISEIIPGSFSWVFWSSAGLSLCRHGDCWIPAKTVPCNQSSLKHTTRSVCVCVCEARNSYSVVDVALQACRLCVTLQSLRSKPVPLFQSPQVLLFLLHRSLLFITRTKTDLLQRKTMKRKMNRTGFAYI